MADSLFDGDQPSREEREAILNKWKDKTKEEILEAKINSDLFIKTKNAQFDDLKKDYLAIREQQQASAQLKELIDQLKSNPNGNVTPQTPQGSDNQLAIKPEDIDSLVEAKVSEKLTKHQTVLKQQENMARVKDKLIEHFGNDYQSVYNQRLDQLGLTKEYADELAKNYPSVFMKTFEIESRPSVVNNNLPKSSQRNTSFAPTTQKRDWNYYQELKKTNPKLYLDPKIANQMHDDAIALGDAFGLPLD